VQLHDATWSTRPPSLLDDYGIADLTMRRLARELSVSPARCTGTSRQAGTARRRRRPDPRARVGRRRRRLVVTVCDGLCTALRNALLSSTDGAELVSASFARGQGPSGCSEILTRLTAAAARGGGKVVVHRLCLLYKCGGDLAGAALVQSEKGS